MGDCEGGQVGVPIPCCKVKLVDVPEVFNVTWLRRESDGHCQMDYYASTNGGEIVVKGLNVFKGYYKNEGKHWTWMNEHDDDDCRGNSEGHWWRWMAAYRRYRNVSLRKRGRERETEREREGESEREGFADGQSRVRWRSSIGRSTSSSLHRFVSPWGHDVCVCHTGWIRSTWESGECVWTMSIGITIIRSWRLTQDVSGCHRHSWSWRKSTFSISPSLPLFLSFSLSIILCRCSSLTVLSRASLAAYKICVPTPTYVSPHYFRLASHDVLSLRWKQRFWEWWLLRERNWDCMASNRYIISSLC